MRRLALFTLALLGAAVAGPAGAWAGGPGAGPSNHGHPFPNPHGPTISQEAYQGHAAPAGHGARCMCPDCQVARAIRQADGATVVIEGPAPQAFDAHGGQAGVPCAACEASAAAPVMLGEAPGHARLNDPALASTEPTPIGVVQTSYAPTGGPVDPAIAAFHRAAQPMRMAPAGALPPSNPWLPSSPGRRPSFLGNLLGTSHLFSRAREARESRRAEAHAAIPMGMTNPNARVTELPASMVYGR